MNFVKASFDEVYNKRSRRNAPIAFASESKLESDFIQYFWGTGYHLYTQLSLEMKYTAPQNIADARKSLEIIQRYTDLAYGCATKISGRLLEVQGERLHFYFDRNNDVPMLQDIIRFCHVLMSAVYENKKYLGDEAFAGFKIAFDHGPAVILESGVGSTMSFVSLGPCANNPAKRLSNVQAGQVSFPTKLAKTIFFDIDQRCPWYDLSLKNSVPREFSFWEDRSFFHNFSAEATTTVQRLYEPNSFDVTNYVITSNSAIQFDTAKLYQGFFMRADLHGFTAKVAEAFSSGQDKKIKELLTDFSKVLAYGKSFIQKTERPIVEIPWAGDCANMLLLAKTYESFEDARMYYPAIGPAEWLSGYKGKICQPFKGAKWLVSLCCGNQDVGNGFVLVGKITSPDHHFLFATGWGVGRSQDAQDIDGTNPNEVLISKEDYQELENTFQSEFHEENTNFMVSGTLKSLYADSMDNVPLLSVDEKAIQQTSIIIPKARPYWDEKN